MDDPKMLKFIFERYLSCLTNLSYKDYLLTNRKLGIELTLNEWHITVPLHCVFDAFLNPWAMNSFADRMFNSKKFNEICIRSQRIEKCSRVGKIFLPRITPWNNEDRQIDTVKATKSTLEAPIGRLYYEFVTNRIIQSRSIAGGMYFHYLS